MDPVEVEKSITDAPMSKETAIQICHCKGTDQDTKGIEALKDRGRIDRPSHPRRRLKERE
ncbi:hypothetical protein EG328_001233, partial [Venturia inaequalis]